uniref:Shedu anti-phage system protein SduA domain-containing protein n=1 Tax=Kovacikia minuta TaxID=2931930 RepID=UPI0026760E4C|nr:Shedu anti-phage system protein SduA domain-containing protein [Kovacikia minuta]
MTILSKTNFCGADLREANLYAVQALSTNFTGAKFTGVCIESWNPSNAVLDDIDCQYVYLKSPNKDRCPSNRNFVPGEFSKLFQANRSYSRLAILEQKINRFEKLLNDNPEGNESLFHYFLKDNPELLDICGTVESKPWFDYPPGKLSPTGKSRLQPDFIIREPSNCYKLVEIEKPGKQIETRQGHPTSLFNQASWQLGEWKTYLDRYSYLLEEKYQGISISEHRSYMLVIGRRVESDYLGLLSNSNQGIKISTYDDLLDKAKQAFENLKALSL